KESSPPSQTDAAATWITSSTNSRRERPGSSAWPATEGAGSSRNAAAKTSGSTTGYIGAIAAKTAPNADTRAAAAIVPPNGPARGTSCSNPETPMNTSRNAPRKTRIGTGATADLKNAAPTAVSSPAKNSQRETTSFTPGRFRTVSAAVGGGRPAPTPKTVTPAIVCPSSEATRHSTV